MNSVLLLGVKPKAAAAVVVVVVVPPSAELQPHHFLFTSS